MVSRPLTPEAGISYVGDLRRLPSTWLGYCFESYRARTHPIALLQILENLRVLYPTRTQREAIGCFPWCALAPDDMNGATYLQVHALT